MSQSISDDDFDALFSSDLARQVRQRMIEELDGASSTGEATANVLAEFRGAMGDVNEGPVVFLAIAATQLDRRALLPEVRDGAIDLIESGEAQRAWQSTDGTLSRQRREMLERLLEALHAFSD